MDSIAGCPSSSSVVASGELSHASSLDSIDGTGIETSNLSEYYEVRFSQGDSTYFVPVCPNDIKPASGMLFSTLDAGIEFYKDYAFCCGFDVRLGGNRLHSDGKTVLLKYLYCNRNGYKDGHNNTGKRTRTSNRVGCKASLTLQFAGLRGYTVFYFEERHTHRLVIDSNRQFMKARRNLNVGHKKFVLNCSQANIGPSSAHRLYKELVGGYSNIGASVVDFKNHRRDMLAHIDNTDAQMLVNRLSKKKELCPAFCFDYAVDSCDRLTRVFWCDPISRKNFSLFGDVVSFDATYRTNRYNLVFAPFTGLNHHKKCVTFGAGLILQEDAGSYIWLLENFQLAMGHDPKILVTDQDGAMKVAIETVFPRTRHRLCMWHIMRKVPGKLKFSPTVESGVVDEFRMKLHSIVWSHALEPAEFEAKCMALFDEYPMENRRWFDDMFALRHFWIPAYFRDVMFGGLVRTTSISESINSYYGHFTDRYFRLSELLMHFDNALESQRHNQSKLNYDSETMQPDLKTPLILEKDASELYTLSVFKELQIQICSTCYSCRIVGFSPGNGITEYNIQEGNLNRVNVMHRHAEEEVICSCRMFQRVGLPCCHMLFVFRNLGMDKIPKKYILPHWTKAATISPIFKIDGHVVEQCVAMEEKELLINELISDFYCCVALAEDNPEQLKRFSHLLKEQKAMLETCSGHDNSRASTNLKSAESLAGINVPMEVSILPPEQDKNKGSGNRIKGGKETSIASRELPKRRCGKSKKYTNHNSRTCTGVLDEV